MNPYFLDMVLCGMAYVIMVYFMMKLMRPKPTRYDRDDEGDGGIDINSFPEIDLPPGVTLPDDPPPSSEKKQQELEEVF